MLRTAIKSEAGFLSGTVLAVLGIGLLVRFILCPTLTYPFDVEHWAVILQNIASGNDLYGLSGYFYTPVWGYILGAEGAVMSLFGNIDLMGNRFTDLFGIETLGFRFFTATTTTPVFNTVMKLPLIAVDLLVGYLVWDLVMEKTGARKKADLAFSLWFLCPVVVYMSSIQVQFDCISALLALLSVLLARKNRYFLAGAVLMVAALTKMFPAFLAPVLVFYVWRKHGESGQALVQVAKAVAGALIAFCIIYAPQILDGTVFDSLSFVFGRATESDPFTLLYVYAMAIVAIVATVVSTYMMHHRGNDLDDVLLLSSTLTLAFANLISGGPQYCIVYLPLLAFLAATYRNRLFVRCFVAIGVLSMLVGILNNNFSILTSVAEYWGWIDPQTIVDLIDDTYWLNFALRAVVQTFQSLVLIVTAVFVGTELLDLGERHYYGQNHIRAIKDKIGGWHTGSS